MLYYLSCIKKSTFHNDLGLYINTTTCTFFFNYYYLMHILGRGVIRGAAHGPLPNPAPATLNILADA